LRSIWHTLYALDQTNRLRKKYPVCAFVMDNEHLYPIENKAILMSLSQTHSTKAKANMFQMETKKREVNIDDDNILPQVDLEDELIDLIANQRIFPQVKKSNGKVTHITLDDKTMIARVDKEKVKKNIET
jgi:hypothetical protein